MHGNASGFSLVTPSGTTEVGDGPIAFALEGARPNPARTSRLDVAYSLPSRAPARLELLDSNGRRLASREVGALGVGRHTLNLAAGRRIAPGVYWVRLVQGVESRSARVVAVE